MLAVGTVLLDAVVVMVLSMVNTELGCGVLRPGGSSAFSKSDVLLLNVGYTAVVVVVGVFVIGCVGGGRVGEQYIVVVDGTKESILVKDKKKKIQCGGVIGMAVFPGRMCSLAEIVLTNRTLNRTHTHTHTFTIKCAA